MPNDHAPTGSFLRDIVDRLTTAPRDDFLAIDNEALRRIMTPRPGLARTNEQFIVTYNYNYWLPAEPAASPPHGFRYCEECGDTIEVSAVTHPGCDSF
jgi:hypothetical protein